MQNAYGAQIVKFSSRINVILEEDRFSVKMTSLGKENSLSPPYLPNLHAVYKGMLHISLLFPCFNVIA